MSDPIHKPATLPLPPGWTVETMAIPTAQSEAAGMIALTERLIRDVSIPLDRVREVLSIRKELQQQDNEQRFNDAMASAQGKMRAIAADSNNPHTSSRYASYYALDKAVRPTYTDAGFALSFDTDDGAPADFVRVVCFVTACGHTRRYHIDMPADGKGAQGRDVMTKTHAAGSAVTYGRRYLLGMIFNLAVGGDDDGNAASGDVISDEQADIIRKLLTETKANVEAFLKTMNAPSVTDIPAKKYGEAVGKLEMKKHRKVTEQA